MKSTILTALLFVSLHLPAYAASGEITAYQTDLHFALFPNTLWTEEEVRKHVIAAAAVFRQCRLEFSSVTIHHVNLELPQRLAAREPYQPNGLVSIAEQTRDLPRPLIYLVSEFSDSGPTPLTKAIFRVNAPPCPPELANTIWVPAYVNTPEYLNERKSSPYSVLAHELTHLFTLDGQHNNDTPPNELSIWTRRTDLLTAEHCREIHESPQVRVVKRPRSRQKSFPAL